MYRLTRKKDYKLGFSSLCTQLLRVILAINIWKTTLAFNLDVQYPIIFEDPYHDSGRGSYFGYSLNMYFDKKHNNSWIQIGAPRANYSDSKYSKNITEPGIVYICSIQPIGKCKELLLDTMEGNRVVTDRYNRYMDRKQGSWLGASMDIQPGPNGRAVVCAPRWINQFFKDEFYQLGICYWMEAEDDLYNRIEELEATKLIPLLDEDRRIYQAKSFRMYDFGVGEAGMSVHMPVKKYYEDTSELLIGAPGIMNWRGGTVLYEDRKVYATSPEGGFSELALQVRDIVKQKEFEYFGYQVNSGYFFSSRELLYVASAPRAEDLKGKIQIFSMDKKRGLKTKEFALKTRSVKQGIQIGEYFGASLAVVDLDRDGLDDIVVGAPFHAREINTGLGYDEGRLAVFMGGKPLIEKQQIIGKETGARFGSAISNLGDLDADGFCEVGVGAPYSQDGRGKVFIYTSRENGLLQPVQILNARDTHGSLRGFGSSINNVAADVDSNECLDVAVGAFKSGHAVIFRGIPVVRWKINDPIPKPKNIPYNAETFNLMEACITYVGKNAPRYLNVSRRVTVDYRCNVTKGTSEKEIRLTKGENFCDNITILMKATIDDKLIPIEVNIQYYLKEEKKVNEKNKFTCHPILVRQSGTEGLDGFCKHCPISQGSTRSLIKIPFEIGCGGDEICHADLSISGRIPQLDISSGAKNISFVIGSMKYLDIKVSVINKAERAYLTRVYIELGTPARISRIPSACNEISRVPYCSDDSRKESFLSTVNSSNSSSLSNHSRKDHNLHSKRNISSIFLRCDLDNPLHPSTESVSSGPEEADCNARPEASDCNTSKTVVQHMEQRRSNSETKITSNISMETLVRNVTVELDMTNAYGYKSMELKAWTTTISVDTNPSDNCWSIVLPLRTEADITIAGRPGQELYTYFKERDAESDAEHEGKIHFYHAYEVQKFGYSPLEKVDIELQIPVAISNRNFKNPLIFLAIKEYQGYQGGQPLSCFQRDLISSEEEPSFDLKEDIKLHNLKKRFTKEEDQENHGTTQVPSNRTLYLNCSSPAREDDQLIKCATLICAAGPFLNSLTVAKVLINLVLDVNPLRLLMGQRDIILLETHGSIKVTEPADLIQPTPQEPDHAWTHTLFLGDIPKKEVESWVLALAIGGGIMLLLFLSMALAKAGFFERKKKEELKALKRMTILEAPDEAFYDQEQEIQNSEDE